VVSTTNVQQRIKTIYVGWAPRDEANAFRFAEQTAPQSGANRHSHAERGNEKKNENIVDFLVPTLCVGMPAWTLRVLQSKILMSRTVEIKMV